MTKIDKQSDHDIPGEAVYAARQVLLAQLVHEPGSPLPDDVIAAALTAARPHLVPSRHVADRLLMIVAFAALLGGVAAWVIAGSWQLAVVGLAVMLVCAATAAAVS